MEFQTLFYTIFFYALLGIGVIVVGRELQLCIRGNALRAGTLQPWIASFSEFGIFLFVILVSLFLLPQIGFALAHVFYPDVNISENPIYAIGFYQPLVLLVVFALGFVGRKTTFASPNAPKEQRSRRWLSLFSTESVWAFFCVAIFCTFAGAQFSEAIPQIIPQLAKYWQANQILIDNLRSLEHNSVLFLAIPAIAIFTPIIEEFFFRAGIYRFLKGKIGTVPAAVLSSFTFAILHDSASSILPLMCLACVLCYTYERSGRLAVPVIIHALFNANTLLAIFLGAE